MWVSKSVTRTLSAPATVARARIAVAKETVAARGDGCAGLERGKRVQAQGVPLRRRQRIGEKGATVLTVYHGDHIALCQIIVAGLDKLSLAGMRDAHGPCVQAQCLTRALAWRADVCLLGETLMVR